MLVAVELALHGDADADGGLVAKDADVVEGVLGREDEIAGAGDDRLVVAFHFPGDFALHDDPPLVVEVVVPVIGGIGRLVDDRGLHLIGERQERGPGWAVPCGALISSSRAWSWAGLRIAERGFAGGGLGGDATAVIGASSLGGVNDELYGCDAARTACTAWSAKACALVRREARPLGSRIGLGKEPAASAPPPLVGLSSLLHSMRVLDVAGLLSQTMRGDVIRPAA